MWAKQRAVAAQASGRLAQEIAPVSIPCRKGTPVIVDRDEHPPTRRSALATLPTPFRSNGTVTAGNASGVNDGAAALILASGEAALELKFQGRPARPRGMCIGVGQGIAVALESV